MSVISGENQDTELLAEEKLYEYVGKESADPSKSNKLDPPPLEIFKPRGKYVLRLVSGNLQGTRITEIRKPWVAYLIDGFALAMLLPASLTTTEHTTWSQLNPQNGVIGCSGC